MLGKGAVTCSWMWILVLVLQIAEKVIEEVMLEVILGGEAVLAARAAVPFLHSVVAYQLIVREVHAAGVAEVRCV